MGFWIFMFLMTLWMPLTMIGFGRYFQKKAPKEINAAFGYRTKRSMKNRDTWTFAHNYFGKLWHICGSILLLPSILVWDNTPFCTLLFIEEEYQRNGYGKQLMEYWEQDMKQQGYGMLLTSTQVDETAQHFYRKLGYKDCGGFVIDIPAYAQPMELFLIKEIQVKMDA